MARGGGGGWGAGVVQGVGGCVLIATAAAGSRWRRDQLASGASTTGAGREQVEGVVGEEDKPGWAGPSGPSPGARFKEFSYLFCFLFMLFLSGNYFINLSIFEKGYHCL